MSRIRDPLFATAIFVLGFLLVSGSFYFFPNEQKSLINYITFTGTYSSIFGIILAYSQILSVRETAEQTKGKIEESNQRVIKILSVSDLSKAIKIVHEIQNYLLSDKDESAVIRMKDLKSILILLKYHSAIKNLTDTEAYKQALNDISINMNNLSQSLIGAKSGINKAKIISDLEIIESQLGEFEGLLKFGEND